MKIAHPGDSNWRTNAQAKERSNRQRFQFGTESGSSLSDWRKPRPCLFRDRSGAAPPRLGFCPDKRWLSQRQDLRRRRRRQGQSAAHFFRTRRSELRHRGRPQAHHRARRETEFRGKPIVDRNDYGSCLDCQQPGRAVMRCDVAADIPSAMKEDDRRRYVVGRPVHASLQRARCALYGYVLKRRNLR